jgi:hypothetical protein
MFEAPIYVVQVVYAQKKISQIEGISETGREKNALDKLLYGKPSISKLCQGAFPIIHQ